jgi:hypothetical protein
MSEEIARIEREADEADEADEDTAQGAQDDGLDLEAPEADSAEQHAELLQHHDEPVTARTSDRDAEADPADIEEQRRVVALDEDDYR